MNRRRGNGDDASRSRHFSAFDGRLVWTTGACGTFAAVLHRLTGLPIYATIDTVPGSVSKDLEDSEVVHAFVLTPDGLMLDAEGASTAPPINTVERVWENDIGDDRHPETRRKGQWWNRETRRLTLGQLFDIRAASEDVNDSEQQAFAEEWIELNRPLFERWMTRRNS